MPSNTCYLIPNAQIDVHHWTIWSRVLQKAAIQFQWSLVPSVDVDIMLRILMKQSTVFNEEVPFAGLAISVIPLSADGTNVTLAIDTLRGHIAASQINTY